MMSVSSPYALPPGVMSPRALSFAEARARRRCQLCWRGAGAITLRKVGVRRTGAPSRWTRGLVCESCLGDELHRPGITFLHLISG
jgi:hypothetical protein